MNLIKVFTQDPEAEKGKKAILRARAIYPMVTLGKMLAFSTQKLLASKTSLYIPFTPPQDPSYKHQECKEEEQEKGLGSQ